jgi:hypothetical protein
VLDAVMTEVVEARNAWFEEILAAHARLEPHVLAVMLAEMERSLQEVEAEDGDECDAPIRHKR